MLKNDCAWISLKPEIDVGAVDAVDVDDVDGFLEIARLLLALVLVGAYPLAIAVNAWAVLALVLMLTVLVVVLLIWVWGCIESADADFWWSA